MSIHRFHFENLLATKYSHWLNHSKYLLVVTHLVQASQVALVVKKPPRVRNAGSVPGLGRSPGLGHNNPLQSSCLEKPMDRGAWWATAHRVTKRQHTHLVSELLYPYFLNFHVSERLFSVLCSLKSLDFKKLFLNFLSGVQLSSQIYFWGFHHLFHPSLALLTLLLYSSFHSDPVRTKFCCVHSHIFCFAL